MTEDPIQKIDRWLEARHQRTRAFLAERDPQALAEYDAQMKDIRSGVDGARRVWHSIRAHQRLILQALATNGGQLLRVPGTKRYTLERGGMNATILLATVRSMANRELLDWDGGSTDPEAAAVLSQRGHFVAVHGPSLPGERHVRKRR